ncbi:hypothetical protein [Mycoplasma suis]|uniref:Uncharacterized protein n=1 Tax=Mycoplasma suis (strain Illinois) TaxID=768700 RepID=F0QQK4_MYCSL|nr:hypothetical protein [Mycoplasma suis]ADX97774.1 hypothetical protein MSU_0230 [Mycoplasma suis str. Illinois]
MIFKGLGGYGWSLMAGIVGAVSAGGYGAISLLGKEPSVDLSAYKWYRDNTKNVPEITFAEYIAKDQEVEKKESVCGGWNNGQAVFLNPSDCQKKVSEKWKDPLEKQPIVWFKSDQKSIQKVLESHFSNDYSEAQLQVTDRGWTAAGGSLECIKKVSEQEEQQYIEVSCSYKEEEKGPPN